MGRATISWRGVLWGLGAGVTSALLALAVVFAVSAVGMRHRLEDRLAEPPLRLHVDLSQPGDYSADWQMPDYGLHGTEFELLATLPTHDPKALLQSLHGFRGTVSMSSRQRHEGERSVAVSASDFTETSQDMVRQSKEHRAFLYVERLRGEGPERLTFTVDQPAPALAGREQVLEARPVMAPLVAVWPIYVSWGLAVAAGMAGGIMSLVLVRARMRRRRGARP